MESFFVKFFGFLFNNTRLGVIFLFAFLFSYSLCWKIHVCIAALLENICLYSIQNIRSRKINGSTSFAIDNMYYVSF